MVIGISFSLLGAMYMVYVIVAECAVVKMEVSGIKIMSIAGVMALSEGKVIRSDDEYTIIQYYSEWDGADYRKVIAHANVNYPEKSKVPIVDILGMAPGSCLVVGFYKKYILILSMTAFLIFVLGLILNLKRKEMDKWQERKL